MKDAKARNMEYDITKQVINAPLNAAKWLFSSPWAITDMVAGKKPLAERNKNPGDLRWAGQTGAEEGEGGFAKFKTEEEGLRAMAAQLKLYQNRDKLMTLSGIISKYAPSSENKTSDYIAAVAGKTGVNPNAPLNLNDPDVLSKVMSAMTKMENGRSNFTPEGIKIVISNNTGGNSTVSTNALPGAAR
jgi:hypothetical protein